MSPPKGKKKGRRQPRRNYRKEARQREKESAQANQRRESAGAATIPAGRPVGQHPGAHTTNQPDAPTRREPSAVVTIEPLSPIIVRSGRPMNAQSDADPARFPPPSTVAGCLRTASARAAGRSFASDAPAEKRADVHSLARRTAAGPLLLDPANHVLAPRPADALYFGRHDEARCVRAKPCPLDVGCDADLPRDLLPVRLTEEVEGKLGPGPSWWKWEDLLAFRDGEPVPHCRLRRNGWSPSAVDRRTHVVIDPRSGASSVGQLFQTEGLDLDVAPAAFRTSKLNAVAAGSEGAPGYPPGGDAPGRTDASVAGMRLLVRFGEPLSGALVHLGGKRRLAVLEPAPEDVWPKVPPDWPQHIAKAKGLCLTLLTPGIFSGGYRPGWLDADLTGSPPDAPDLRLRLCAAAVERWQPHSGWDLARRAPRATRKLAPAGAVYWFRILGGGDPETFRSLWLVSDNEQDRRDGFGLALPSPWTPAAKRCEP